MKHKQIKRMADFTGYLYLQSASDLDGSLLLREISCELRQLAHDVLVKEIYQKLEKFIGNKNEET